MFGLIRCHVRIGDWHCPTQIQRTVSGSLVNGMARHLEVVHGMAEDAAWDSAVDAIRPAKGD